MFLAVSKYDHVNSRRDVIVRKTRTVHSKYILMVTTCRGGALLTCLRPSVSTAPTVFVGEVLACDFEERSQGRRRRLRDRRPARAASVFKVSFTLGRRQSHRRILIDVKQ